MRLYEGRLILLDTGTLQEGVPFLLPFLTKRVVRLDLPDFAILLTKRCMLFADLKTPGAVDVCAQMGGGCMLFLLNSEVWTGQNSVYLSGWRGTQQLTLFVSKMEALALSHKILGTSKQKEEKEEEAAAECAAGTQFTCFTSAKVHILTPEEYAEATASKDKADVMTEAAAV